MTELGSDITSHTNWSHQQEEALKAIRSWLAPQRNRNQVFYLAGYAGTGKTTLCRALKNELKKVVFGAFTGKAALVMRSKGCTGARTIHSLIYSVEEGQGEVQTPTFVLNPLSDVNDANLVVIDECSMVGAELGKDLLSFGKPVLVIGDPMQLPPVGDGTGFFTRREPDFMLTEVHRQARGNPIIAMSMSIREGEYLEYGRYGESRIIPRSEVNAAELLEADQILVGTNATRTKYNSRVRELKKIKDPYPVVGDRLVCLRNDRHKKLLNGGLWDVKRKNKTADISVGMTVVPEDAEPGTKGTTIRVRKEMFDGREQSLRWEDKRGFDDFTFGYVLTVHKAQGSQWNNVFLFDESRSFGEHARRHIYTALTRAAERITIVM